MIPTIQGHWKWGTTLNLTSTDNICAFVVIVTVAVHCLVDTRFGMLR